MSKKRYFIPGVDQIDQLVETPASKARTEKQRFIITVIFSAIGAITSIIAAVFSVLAYFR